MAPAAPRRCTRRRWAGAVVALALAAAGLYLLLGDARQGDGSSSDGSESAHPHRGKLKPFQRGKPSSIRLDSSDEKTLASGQPWFSVQRKGQIGIGKAVVDVAAPPDIVWGQLLDFDKYPGKVPKVGTCKVYNKRREGRSQRIFVHFISPLLPGYKFQYYCDHTYEVRKSSMTWSLDYDRLSDFEDVQGHWHVEPHPENEGWARVFYEVQLMTPKYLPSIVVNLLTSRAIKDATTWVRTFSEKEAAKKGLKLAAPA